MVKVSVRRRIRPTIVAALAAGLMLTSCGDSGGSDSAADKLDCEHRATISGVAPPHAIDETWQSVFVDDFNRCELGENWSAYDGRPGGAKYGKWHPSMVSIDNGALRLHSRRDGDDWKIGGVSNWPVTQKYGRWEVRYKVQPNADISYHFLLWPQNEKWPPEIDFAEDASSQRDGIAAFLHWKDGSTKRKANAHIAGDAPWVSNGRRELSAICSTARCGRSPAHLSAHRPHRCGWVCRWVPARASCARSGT